MIFSCPPQRVQLAISTPNTRFRRRAQLIATCRGVDGWVGSAPDTGNVAAPRPRCAGVTDPRFFAGRSGCPSVEVDETEREYRVIAELPGVDERDVEVLLQDGLLTVRGLGKHPHIQADPTR
jgi:HSP20 family molecular chaperone IbpA